MPCYGPYIHGAYKTKKLENETKKQPEILKGVPQPRTGFCFFLRYDSFYILLGLHRIDIIVISAAFEDSRSWVTPPCFLQNILLLATYKNYSEKESSAFSRWVHVFTDCMMTVFAFHAKNSKSKYISISKYHVVWRCGADGEVKRLGKLIMRLKPQI